MSDELEEPLPPDELFEYRRDGADEFSSAPPLWLPYSQGDIFEGVTLPGLNAQPSLGMIFMHPCTMRAGVALKPLITMVAVESNWPSHSFRKKPELWRGFFRGMCLIGLDGSDTPFHANFLAITSSPSEDLHRSKRIATLTVEGRLQFQQRVIHHLTRFSPSIGVLEEETRPVELELTMQTDWMRKYCAGGDEGDDAIATQESYFDEYMRALPGFSTLRDGTVLDPSKSRRDLLSEAPSELKTELFHYLGDP